MTVVQYEEPQPLPASRPGDEDAAGPRGWVARLRGAAEIANYIGGTEFVPEGLRNKPAAIAAAILYGEEIGLDPMQSLAKIAVIHGRPTLTAEAQRALIAAAGHELWFEESTITRAIAAGRRADSERVGRVTWTMDDAKRAGLDGQANYRRYPAEMLRARASAALARAMFADVIGGLAAAEELEGEPDNGTPLEPPQAELAGVTPQSSPPAGRSRRRATAPAPPPAGAAPVTPTPPPDAQPEPPMPPEPLATDAMKRKIFALMRDVGLQTAERDSRLDYTRRTVGRPELASSNELTIGEADRLIVELEAVKALPPDERAARLMPPDEAAVVEALQELATGAAESAPTLTEGAGGPDAAPGAGDPPTPPEAPEGGQNEPVPYNEFPEGF